MAGPVRIALFAALLAAVFGGALALGSVVDPDVRDAEDEAGGHESAAPAQRGLAVAQDGLRLVVDQDTFPRARTRELSFRILGEDGEAATTFEEEHERRMHVIVVRRDLTGYQHIHPRMGADGTWSVDLHLSTPGVYRLYADFTLGDGPITLATDVTVPGASRPAELPEPATVARTDGYEVELSEDESDVSFTVTRDGRAVTDIQPYLGARGHLVVLREGDLAYLHVHPEDEATAGREIRFGVEYPSAGRYRLFLQFKHEGRIHTAAFSKEVEDAGGH